MSQLAVAMAPLDTERALQFAARLPITGYNGTSFDAQRSIALWMIADASDRASRPFSFWSSNFEHESRYSNEW
jgi:hypothetical protein